MLFLGLAILGSISIAHPAYSIWPTPQKIETLGKGSLPAVELEAASVLEFPALVAAYRAQNTRPQGDLSLRTVTGDAGTAALGSAGVPKVPGAYLLDISTDGITMTAAGETGLFYASQSLAQLIRSDLQLPHCRIVDWPDIPFRGSIEGFYGKPWEHERRLSQIRFYGRYKMNAYIYGPKDDPYSGFNSHKWREPYPEAQARQISELVELAKANHVNFIWALHPGSSIRWDDKDEDGLADDIIVAQEKLEAMYQLGVRSFAIFFDDIGGEGAKASMQAKMLNHINREFIQKKGDLTPLILCPTDYAGAHGSAYKKELGAALDKDIEIMWTGPGICSDIPADAVKAVSEHWQRKPFIWWNWPVNDYCRTNLLMGRTYGLDKANKDLLSGFASNPMDKPEASKLGLFSIADWAWNVDAFDSEASWHAAFPRLYPEAAEAMFVFAKHNSDQGSSVHGYRREESVEVMPIVEKALADYRSSKELDAVLSKRLDSEFAEIRSAAEHLMVTLPRTDPALWHEIEFWVKSFGELGRAGRAAIQLASGQGGDGASHMALFSTIATAKLRQDEYYDAQKQRHFNETFPSDKRWSKGCRVATRVLTPFVDELLKEEWAKAYAKLGGQANTDETVYQAFSNSAPLQKLQASRDGKYVSIDRVLEVLKLKPGEYIGLALPEEVHANYIHITLDKPEAAAACEVEISTDSNNWTIFNARRSGGEIQNPLSTDLKIRFFRMVNRSEAAIDFRIERFKFDVPEDARHNSILAAADGDPLTAYTIREKESFTGPDGARAAFLVTDAPEAAITRKGNTVTLSPSKGDELHLFEIVWR